MVRCFDYRRQGIEIVFFERQRRTFGLWTLEISSRLKNSSRVDISKSTTKCSRSSTKFGNVLNCSRFVFRVEINKLLNIRTFAFENLFRTFLFRTSNSSTQELNSFAVQLHKFDAKGSKELGPRPSNKFARLIAPLTRT